MSFVTGLTSGSLHPAVPLIQSCQVSSHPHKPEPPIRNITASTPIVLTKGAQLTTPACQALGTRMQGGGGIMAAAASARLSPHSRVRRLSASCSSSSTGHMTRFHLPQPHTSSTSLPASFRPSPPLLSHLAQMRSLFLMLRGDARLVMFGV